jgi:hypothetical protein
VKSFARWGTVDEFHRSNFDPAMVVQWVEASRLAIDDDLVVEVFVKGESLRHCFQGKDRISGVKCGPSAMSCGLNPWGLGFPPCPPRCT